LSRYGLLQAREVTTRPRSTPKAITAGLASGVTTMVAHSGGPPLAMYLLPLGLSKDVYAGTTKSVLHHRQRDQGGTLAPACEADRQRLDI